MRSDQEQDDDDPRADGDRHELPPGRRARVVELARGGRCAAVLLDCRCPGCARHRLEVADLGSEQDPAGLSLAPGLQRLERVGVERHERTESRPELGQQRSAATAVIAVGGLPAVHVGHGELQLECTRLTGAGALDLVGTLVQRPERRQRDADRDHRPDHGKHDGGEQLRPDRHSRTTPVQSSAGIVRPRR